MPKPPRMIVFPSPAGSFLRAVEQAPVREDDLAGSNVDVEIDAATVDTREERRDAHLRSADFLDAERFPTIAFRSTRVEPGRGDAFRVVGDLTIRGVTRRVRSSLGGRRAFRVGRDGGCFGGFRPRGYRNHRQRSRAHDF